MGKYILAIKNFMISMFTQDEEVGLKSLERKEVKPLAGKYKMSGDFKISEIMKG